MWWLIVYVALAGAVGGVVNALLTDNGFALPRREKVDKLTIYRPGWTGNVLIGMVAAAVSWGLYGPLASYLVAGTPEAMSTNDSPEQIGLALSSLVGAVLIGIGGARWLTNEVDKTLLRAAASAAAGADPQPSVASQIAMATPMEALDMARAL
jgi:hypothetical protein